MIEYLQGLFPGIKFGKALNLATRRPYVFWDTTDTAICKKIMKAVNDHTL